MTVAQMVAFIKSRTKVQDDTKVLGELQNAYRWCQRRAFNTEGGPDLLVTIDTEVAINAVTTTFDISANVTGEFLSLKQLWLKFANDTVFTPMVPSDSAGSGFIRSDGTPSASAATNVAKGHPVLYDLINYNNVRFAPSLPSGCTVRIDFYRLGVLPDPTTFNTLSPGSALPDIFHDCVISKATAQVFNLIDDSRESTWETRAREELQDALFVATGRNRPNVVQTQPFRSRRRRFI